MLNLDELQTMIIKGATVKGYNNDTDWLIRKLKEEFEELQMAIQFKTSDEDISEECADMVIVLSQIQKNECNGLSFTDSIYDKMVDNFTKKKKTLDKTTGQIVRR